VALRAIRRVTEEGAWSNLAVPAELARSGLDLRDRQFAAELAYGTLRRLLPLDRSLAAASTRPLTAIDPEALAILRLGAYQLLWAGVAPHAAVGETVGLASARHRAFANAVLRAVARSPLPPPAGDSDGAVSGRTGLAPWAVAELRRLLPADEVEPAAAALASPAGLTLRVNRCRATVAEVVEALRADGREPEAGRWHPDVLRLARGAPSDLPGHDRGWFAVQDEASALVAAAAEVRAGERVLDACAGPGGKAAHLACAVGEEGVLVAADAGLPRARLAARTLARLGTGGLALVQDARAPALREGFDAAVVDAPCSGLGAARRRPELLWRPSPLHLSALARRQVAIVVGVAGLLRPGGRLVYSVCTFPRAETEAAVRAILSKRPDLEPAEVPGPDGPAAVHRLWPHRHGTDAMFIAGFRRRD
jgi:16S rRNA (cytosine967-C5)-methyltransferase